VGGLVEVGAVGVSVAEFAVSPAVSVSLTVLGGALVLWVVAEFTVPWVGVVVSVVGVVAVWVSAVGVGVVAVVVSVDVSVVLALVVVLVIEDPGEVLWGVGWARSDWGSSRLWDVNVVSLWFVVVVIFDIDWLGVTLVDMAGTVVLGDVSGGWSISVVVVPVVTWVSVVGVVAVSVVRVVGFFIVGVGVVVAVVVTVVVRLFIGVMVVGVGVVCVVISITGKVAVGWGDAARTVATSVRVVVIVGVVAVI